MPCTFPSSNNNKILTSQELVEYSKIKRYTGGIVIDDENERMINARLFLLRRNNQIRPVLYTDGIIRRSSPYWCATTSNDDIFTITNTLTTYSYVVNNETRRTGSYYIPSNVDENTSILFNFRGSSTSADSNSPSDRTFIDLYKDTDLILISIHPLTDESNNYNYDIFDDETGISTDRLGNEDDVLAFEEIKDKVISIYDISSNTPVYAKGHSSGGIFCYRLAKENLVDGIIVSGANYIDTNLELPTTSNPIPVIIAHNDEDSVVSFTGTVTEDDDGIMYYSTYESANAWATINNSGTTTTIESTTPEINILNIGTTVVPNNITVNEYTANDVTLFVIESTVHIIPKDIESIIRDSFLGWF